MTCAVCKEEIHGSFREFQEMIVCRSCMRDLADLTRETGGEMETRSEIEHERFVDSIIGVYA